MKKMIALVLVLCMALALCACGSTASSAPAASSSDSGSSTAPAADKGGEKVVKIGVYEPLSGDNGAGGKQETLGMQYANYVTPTVEINGETYQVELVIADNESSNDKAVSAATDLISAGCSVVLGSYGSGVSIAASDTFEEAGLPAIGVTCTNPQVTEGNSHYFRVCFLDPFQGTVLANFAYNDLGAKTAYCLGQLGNDYDQGLINYFKQAAEGLGMKVITAEFPENNSDFTSYLTNAKNEGADVIFAPCSISYAQLIVEQADAQGIEMPLLAGDTWDSNAILAAAEGKNVQINVSTFYAEGGDPEFEKGIKEWLNSNSEAMTNNGGNDMIAAVTVMGYDAYYTALEAMKAAGSVDKADILAALPGVTLTGVSGAIAFNEIGDANRDSAYIKQANTETVVWDFVTVATVG